MPLAILCGTGTATAAATYRLGPVYRSETELLVPNANATTGSCGVERWSVKTGTDPDAGQVDSNTSTVASIKQLVAIEPPAALPPDQRISPTETTVFTVSATLTGYKLEADSDYHLVITDSDGRTMITEIPDPACVGASSPFLGDIQTARQVFDDRYAVTGTYRYMDVPVCITGVGFFDFVHGQAGVAPNGLELHPVLGLQVDPVSCQARSGSTPATAKFLSPTRPVSVTAGKTVPFKVQCLSGSDPLHDWRLDFGDGAPPATGPMKGTSSGTATVSHIYSQGQSKFVATLTCSDTQNITSVPATVAVNVNRASSGGGAISLWTLLGLELVAGWTLLRAMGRRPR